MKKTDKYRLIEGRGKGDGKVYKPFYKTHEITSIGRKHRALGWFNRRIHYFLSDLEFYYFLLIQWFLRESIVDIKEQYPLPLEQTLLIADRLGIKHPKPSNKIDKHKVVTTDFLITFKRGNVTKDIARAIKPTSDLEKKRTIEKLKIEEDWFTSQGIDWGIVTEKEIPKTIAMNIKFLYHDFYWAENMGLSDAEVDMLRQIFVRILTQNNYEIYKTCNGFEKLLNWDEDTALPFLKYLLAKKELLFDIRKRLNFSNIKVWLP